MHKGFNCLDVTEGRVYISHDVIFYETNFSFAKLNPNVGARLHSEILLLPNHIFVPTPGCELLDDSCTNVQTNASSSAAKKLASIGGEQIPSRGDRIQISSKGDLAVFPNVPGTDSQGDSRPRQAHADINPDEDPCLRSGSRSGSTDSRREEDSSVQTPASRASSRT
jgi:hypothetical protein